MSFDIWLAYTVAAFIIIILPGPTILLVVTRSIHHGITAAIPLVIGVFFGDLIAMIGSLLGLGLIVASSDILFTGVKVAGAVYLVYLGISLWRAPIEHEPIPLDAPLDSQRPSKETINVARANSFALARSAFLVTVLNPKGIVFFMAFLPQFINSETAILPQLTLFGLTFLVLAVINASGYAILAARVSELFQQPQAKRCFNRLGAVALILAGLITLFTQDVTSI